MKKSTFLSFAMVVIMSVMVLSCKKTPAPNAEIFATIVDYQVTFNPVVTDADTYSWNFGDGSDLSTDKAPVHTYESFGDYTVTLTVTGDGGSFTATKTISIAATSIKDLLTGGQSATSGKTWVLDRAFTAGDGGGPVTNSPYTIAIPSAENVLDMFGLGDEYDNEFTFFFNGNYSVSPKNGKVLAGAVYGLATGTISGDPVFAVGLCTASWSAPASATWTHSTSDLVIDAIGNSDDGNIPPAHQNVTITGKNVITITSADSKAFFGIKDFPATAQFIIDEITPNKMRVTLFLCGYAGYDLQSIYNMMPSNMFHLSYIKKTN
ncbi:MAG: PKD domain-containing protein [Bacteroidales bacterium]|jgi:PKD repeat protein|nr:PKD domain-containing protein [Bacteroidales bacterium]